MSDLKPQSRFRLASKESHQPTFPVAGPIPNHAFLGPLEGGISLALQYEQALAFEERLALGELAQAKLSTTGYDDPELTEMAEQQAAAFTPPPAAGRQKINLSPLAPPNAKPIAGFEALPAVDLPVSSPRLDARTLRTKIAFGPNPNKPKPAPAPATAKAAPVVSKPAAAPAPSPAKVVKPTVQPPVQARPAAPSISVKPTVKPASAPPPPPPAPVQQPAAAAAAAATAPAPAAKPAPETPKPEQKPAAAAPEKKEERTPPPAEKPKINVRPAATAPARPAVPARSGNAVPAERPEPAVAPPPPPAPSVKPKVQPIRPTTPEKPSVAAETPAAVVSSDASFSLGMGAQPTEGPGMAKYGIIAAVVVVLAGGGYFLFKGDSSSGTKVASSNSSGPAATITDQTPPNMIIGGGGWATNWGNQEPINKSKNISLFRPTLNMPDYRIEFRGQVEQKALGWVFRAKDPKNYYVMKIEMIKRGLNPVFALVKYAVLNGKENTHTQIMLEGDYRQDNVWRVRQDVRGNKFTTYVQDKLADYWTDDEIKTGGAGFYNDKGEYGQIKLSTFSYLPATGK